MSDAPVTQPLAASPWRQPVVWLGVVVVLGSLCGCLYMIGLAFSLPEERPMASSAHAPSGTPPILKMPVERVPSAPAAKAP